MQGVPLQVRSGSKKRRLKEKNKRGEEWEARLPGRGRRGEPGGWVPCPRLGADPPPRPYPWR